MTATVAVLGGGYGGIAAAQALDEVADVVLVEPREMFVHNVAALRALVDPGWTDRIFLPYDRLLARGRVLRDRATRAVATTVTLASSRRIRPDFIVLATGSAYPFPAKPDVADATAAKERLHATRDALARADRVLLLGAGPVGLELAGEITAAWPGKAVTIVDPAADIVSGGFTPEFRAELRRQLEALGVELVLGTTLAADPPSVPGEAKAFTAVTRSGRRIEADIWFRCHGVVPSGGHLAGAAARADGHVEVTADLRLPGSDHVFAVGDITAIAEAKTAKAAGLHADVVAANIRTLIEGGTRLLTYRPGPAGISLPLGPAGGASYSPDAGTLGAEQTARHKGADLKIDTFTRLLGVEHMF